LNAVGLDPKVSSFVASAGWFERFMGRHGFHNLKLTGDAAAGDVAAAEKFPAQFRAVIEGMLAIIRCRIFVFQVAIQKLKDQDI
jgi:hypothetical protein